MATVTGLTAERMQEIIDATVVDANVVGNNLILTLHDGSTVDCGNVRGPTGATGATGAAGAAGLTVCTSSTRPSSPTEGRAIYETDTNRIYVYNGSAWVYQWSDTFEHEQYVVLNPAGNADMVNSIMGNWGGSGSGTVTCPPWATQAVVTTHIAAFYNITDEGNAHFATSFGGVDGQQIGITGTLNKRDSTSWIDTFTGLTAGAKTVRPRGVMSTGSGAFRADTLSSFGYTVRFKP